LRGACSTGFLISGGFLVVILSACLDHFQNPLIVFHPEHFFDKLDRIKELGFAKTCTLNWDDAGLWLYAMDWDDPFIEAFTKWLNVARTNLNSLICSTPSPTFIFKKLRTFPSAITVRILKNSGPQDHRWRRMAKGYQHYLLPDLHKTRVKPLFVDNFTCRMPTDFYAWYKPFRNQYANLAQRLMEEKWKELKHLSKSKALNLSEYPGLRLPTLDKRILG
jgi:hypothetical protein